MKRSVRITFFLCLISTLCAILLTSCNIPIQLYTLSGLEYRINEDGETCTIIGIGKYKSTDLEIPEKIGDYMVTTIGKEAFCAGRYEQCANLTSITLPEGLTTIEDFAFMGCKKVKEIIVPDTVTTINAGAFQECVQLEKLILPKGLTTISVQMCIGCQSLKEIKIPDSVTEIKDAAFAEAGLETVTIGTNVKRIEGFAFLSYYKSANAVYYEGTLAQWQEIERGSAWIGDEDCTFYCEDFEGMIGEVYQ